MDAMQHCSMSNTSRGWLAGHPLSLQNIIMLLSMKSRTHSHRESFIGRTNWIQAIYENAHRICSFGIFCTSGEILARKIDSLIVHSYSYIHTHVINMHPFDSFHDQKKWLKMHNNVFIEIQCKLIPFIRTLNLLWGRSINAKKEATKVSVKKSSVSSLNELFCQWLFWLKTFSVLILWLYYKNKFPRLVAYCCCILRVHVWSLMHTWFDNFP